jgi:hypothetical protein
MKIDPEKVMIYLRERWPEGGLACPLCHNDKFSFSDIIFTLAEYDPAVMGSIDFPVIPVICDGCGNVMLFSAVKMGILKGDG